MGLVTTSQSSMITMPLFIHYCDTGWIHSQGQTAPVAWRDFSQDILTVLSGACKKGILAKKSDPPPTLPLAWSLTPSWCGAWLCQGPSHPPSALMDGCSHTAREIPNVNTGQGVKGLAAGPRTTRRWIPRHLVPCEVCSVDMAYSGFFPFPISLLHFSICTSSNHLPRNHWLENLYLRVWSEGNPIYHRPQGACYLDESNGLVIPV